MHSLKSRWSPLPCNSNGCTSFSLRATTQPLKKWLAWLTLGIVTTALIAGLIFWPQVRLNRKLSLEIHDRKAAEEKLQAAKEDAEKANIAKRQFVAQVTHELRTPLNSLMGLTEIMLDAEDDADKREQLSIIQNSGHSCCT